MARPNDNEKLSLLQQQQQQQSTVNAVSHYDAISEECKESTASSRGSPNHNTEALSFTHMGCILSTAFSYGCVLTTLFLITLPVECERMHTSFINYPKSVALGAFVCIAGVTQLISPLVGQWSDLYHPPAVCVGQRLPYFIVGALWTMVGLLGQTLASLYELWGLYSIAFFVSMIGINVLYAMMLAILADQVPSAQVGTANGILAFQLVVGSLFGFGMFHTLLGQDISHMYYLYLGCVVVSVIWTVAFAHEKDAQFAWHDRNLSSSPPPSLWRSFTDPLYDTSWWQSYTMDMDDDFFYVTVSRLFYYCGNSVQTFFLYFLHDIIHVQDTPPHYENPEAAVARLAMMGQLSGAFVCYPIGILSDAIGRDRRPIVFVACAIFSACTVSMIVATTMQDMIVLCLVLGAANGIYLTMETSLAVDTLPDSRSSNQLAAMEAKDTDDEKDKKKKSNQQKGSAQLLGIWGVAAFLGSALGPMVGGPLLYFFGKQSNEDGSTDEEYSLRGYAVVLSLSSFYFFCSAWALRYIKGSRRTRR